MVDNVGPREPWYRSRSPEQIVRSALAQIVRKQGSGCPSCVDAYIALARENCATEQQISTALNGIKPVTVEHGSTDDDERST